MSKNEFIHIILILCIKVVIYTIVYGFWLSFQYDETIEFSLTDFDR